jgi:3-deoxy-D-manno-octulosonic-acid transferase
MRHDAELHVVLSVTTSTGFDLAERSDTDRLHVIYNPIDLAGIVRRTLDAVRPRALVLVEGAWPVLVSEAWKRNIPVSLVARLSPRSARRFQRFRNWTGPVFALLDAVFVQEQEDVQIWQNLGAREGAIHCTGAIKYDEPPSEPRLRPEFQSLLHNLGASEAAPILLAGSTFPGEEIILARTFLELRKSVPGLFLILVPRHVERTPEILKELSILPLKVARRSESQPESADVLLVDTTGELRDWYSFATVVFIGKSLTSTGGQNPVEPALQGKPVVFGPHMENFAPIVRQWLACDAAVQVTDESDLRVRLEQLLHDRSLRERLSANALQAISVHFGATQKVLTHLKQHTL